MQSVVWDINPFDQWGVELGKQMATGLMDPLSQRATDTLFDASTNGLLGSIFEQKGHEA